MKKLIACLGCFLTSGVSLVWACSCLPPPAPKEAFASAGAVFSGTVETLQEEGGDLKVTLRVLQSWKGTNAETLVVYTTKGGAMCGYGFTRGSQYLIYASVGTRSKTNKTDLSTGLCSRTAELAAAADDLRSLGTGRTPTKK